MHACRNVLMVMSALFIAGVVAGSWAVHASASTLPVVRSGAQNRVPACVQPARLQRFLRARNRLLSDRYSRIARIYAETGRGLAIRWDIAFFQMMVETANLSFRRPDGSPGDVGPAQNNFAGLGAIGDGRPGEAFTTLEIGVRAHLEHVLHYAGLYLESPVAERTRKVQEWRVLANWHRSFARPITFTDVARRWAPNNAAYLNSIELLAHKYQKRFCRGRPVLVSGSSGSQPSLAPAAWVFRTAAPAALVPPMPVKAAVGQLHRQPSAAAPRRAVRTAARPKPRVRPPAHRPVRRSVAPRVSENDRLRQMISDRRVVLTTRIGAEVPIHYHGDGRMVGEAGTALSFILGASQDSGRWWIARGRLCQQWRIWLDGDEHCIRLKEQGGTIHWESDDGERGTARVVARSTKK